MKQSKGKVNRKRNQQPAYRIYSSQRKLHCSYYSLLHPTFINYHQGQIYIYIDNLSFAIQKVKLMFICREIFDCGSFNNCYHCYRRVHYHKLIITTSSICTLYYVCWAIKLYFKMSIYLKCYHIVSFTKDTIYGNQ